MHRYLVEGHGWLSGGQFTDSMAVIAVARAAPGSNELALVNLKILFFDKLRANGFKLNCAASISPMALVAVGAVLGALGCV